MDREPFASPKVRRTRREGGLLPLAMKTHKRERENQKTRLSHSARKGKGPGGRRGGGTDKRDKKWPRKGLGDRICRALLKTAKDRGAQEATSIRSE